MAFPFSLILLFSLIPFFLSHPCHAHVYVFGDSLADAGNNNHIHLSLLKANFPHNGIDYPGRRPTGRFSNGKNFPDFLAEKLGAKAPPPYLSLVGSSATDELSNGVNFASGGAGILDSTNQNQCLSLDKQIEYFSRVREALQRKLGSKETENHLSRSIFVVVIGSNDLLNFFKSARADSTQLFVDSLVLTLKGQLKSIYDLGGRKIALLGTGPIGCTPSERLRSKNEECNGESNSGSVKLNEGVGSLLKEMKMELRDFSYSFFDTYAALMEIIANPSSYGFTEVRAACCGLGELKAKIACLPIASYCSNREDHLFWDFYHPTEAAARKLSDTIFNGSPPLVHPLNVRQLASLPL